MKHLSKISGLILLVGLYAGFADVAFSMSKAEAQDKCNKTCAPNTGTVTGTTGGASKSGNPSGGNDYTWGSGSASCTCNHNNQTKS